jgi:hypothetical protein
MMPDLQSYYTSRSNSPFHIALDAFFIGSGMGAERANSPPKLDPSRLQLGTQDSIGLSSALHTYHNTKKVLASVNHVERTAYSWAPIWAPARTAHCCVQYSGICWYC